ncbi:MAG: FKBP-type peptidyl-prolyl cis-trans isomerase [Ferruginibacter sp.]
MKYCFSLLLLFNLAKVNGQFSYHKGYLFSHDSVKATAVYAEAMLRVKKPAEVFKVAISADKVSLGFIKHGNQRSVIFSVPLNTNSSTIPPDVFFHGPNFIWNYDWQENQSYPLMIMTAHDSAAKSTIYSGYIYLTGENKWKLLGAALLINAPEFIQKAGLKNVKNKRITSSYSNKWLFRNTGKWMKIDSSSSKQPVLRPMSNIDSIAQQKTEEEELKANSNSKGEKFEYRDGVFYQLLKEGAGRELSLTDTIDVHYKGWLYSNGNIFDQTKEKPASFPLARLIRGWQVGLPGTKVGGKIRLYIPSGSAYGIRTFSPKIPPNSTLVFDIEVVNARSKN